MANININPMALTDALGATPGNLTPNEEADFRANRTNLMAVIAALNMLQLQQQQNAPPVGGNAPPPLPVGPVAPLRGGGIVGVGAEATAWVGGSIQIDPNAEPQSAKAYRSVSLNNKMKTEKACTAGLPEEQRLPVPGSMDDKDFSSVVSLTDWIRLTSAFIVECGMDTVFRTVIGNQEIYLLKNWGQATKTIIDAHVADLRANGDDYDRTNLAMSGKFLLNSLDGEMLKRTSQELGQTLTTVITGPDVFCAVIGLHSMLNDSTERQFIEKLRKMKLSDEPGEDVDAFSNKVLALAHHITGLSDGGVADLHTLVYTTFNKCSTETFATAVSNILSQCYLRAPVPRLNDWEYQVTGWKGMYRDLKSRGEWVALASVRETVEAQGLVGEQYQSLTAEIQRLTRIVGSQASTSQGSITCFTCGEPGHKSPQCPNKDSGNTQGALRSSATNTATGMQVKKAPVDGEPHTKMHQNVQYKWCSTCKKWNSGAKAHLTAEHVKRVVNQGQLAQQEPAPSEAISGTLSRVSGFFATTPITSPIVPLKPVITRNTHFLTGITPGDRWCIEDEDGCPSNIRGARLCTVCRQYSSDPHHEHTTVHAYNLHIQLHWKDNQSAAALQAPSRIAGFIGSITNVSTEEEKAKGKVKADDLAKWFVSDADGNTFCNVCNVPVTDHDAHERTNDHFQTRVLVDMKAWFSDNRYSALMDHEDDADTVGKTEEGVTQSTAVVLLNPNPNYVPNPNHQPEALATTADAYNPQPIYSKPQIEELSRFVTDDKPPLAENEDETEASDSYTSPWKKLVAFLWSSFLVWMLKKTKFQANVSDVPLPLAQLPSIWMVLTGVIHISMWWIGMLLSQINMTWTQYNDRFGPKLQFMRQKKLPKPPDPTNKWETFLREYLEMETTLGKKQTFWSRLFHLPASTKRKRYMLLALNAAVMLARQQPIIQLSEHRTLRNDLRSYKRSGQLLTGKINDDVRLRLRRIIADEPMGLMATGGDFELIIDTGCSKTSTGYESDFVPGSLKTLSTPIRMDGISGGLTIAKEGIVRYEIIDDKGNLQVLLAEAYLIPDLTCRLFSPQAYFKQLRNEGANPDDSCRMTITQDKSVLHFGDSQTSIYYDKTTHLPRIHAYSNAFSSANAIATVGCVTDEANQNLSPAQKTLLKWHFRLGHLGFATVQWLGRSGMLGSHGEKMGAARLIAPKCAACQFGKQGKTPTPTHHSDKDPPGSLTKEKLLPGDLIFADQYDSRAPGRAFTTKGLSSSSNFNGGTLFIDAASNYISVSHQVGTTAAETIQSKTKFEREAITCGVDVKAYHTDNGIFTSKEFMRELAEKGQGITLSGVSAQFQNGAAENAIKIVVRNARTMMIHASIRWPGFVEKDLWPMALSHAAYLFNVTPNMATGVSPMSVFTRATQEIHTLRNTHTWGCPVYVLAPKLKDGLKIPKWEPRSKRGQYVGNSPLHASTVGLVRNLQTGSITPQFHMVFDDYFETVHSIDDDQEPEIWNELLHFHRFQAEMDDDDYVPQLPDEWLDQQELQVRMNERARDRDQAMIRLDAGHVPVGLPQRRRAPAPAPPAHPTLPPMAPVPQAVPIGIQPQIVAPPVPVVQPIQAAPIGIQPQTVVPQIPNPTTAIPRPQRNRAPPVRFSDEHGRYYAKVAAALCMTTAKGLVSCSIGYESDYRYLLALLTNTDNGTLDTIHPAMIQFPGIFKATPGKDPDLPTYREAMAGPDRESYEEAMDLEVHELEEHGTWKLVRKDSLPTGTKVLPSTWVLRAKRYPDGRLRKHKARFCVRGDRQIEGVDYTEKYSPVVSWSTVRMLLTMSINQNLCTKQVDFSNAFVQAKLKDDEHIYVEMPKGYEYVDNNDHHHILKLNRSLYGLVQAPLYWGNHLKDVLEKNGLKQSVCDPCMYIGDGVICLTYVDDCLFFGKDQSKIDSKIKSIQDCGLKLTVEDDIYAFLGVELDRKSNGDVELRQRGLIDKILFTCQMTDCNTKATPSNQVPLGSNLQGDPVTGKFEYASVVGMLMYLSSNSRPDIQYAVHQCARFTHFPKKIHEDAILRICRYLKGTKDRGLYLKNGSDLTLDCYVDADFAGLYNVEDNQDPVCVKSRTGYSLTLGGCPLIWVSKLQTEIALSTTEAEYIALSQSLRDLIPMRRLLREASSGLGIATVNDAHLHSTVFEDNNGALSLATSPKMSPRTKHIAIKYHHFRDSVGADKGIIIEKIDTTLQKADILTKGLPADTHVSIRRLLMGW